MRLLGVFLPTVNLRLKSFLIFLRLNWGVAEYRVAMTMCALCVPFLSYKHPVGLGLQLQVRVGQY